MASTGPATNEKEARQSWTSAYPFEPYSSGDGILVAVTTSAATSGTLVGDNSVNTICINNMTAGWVSVRWGVGSVTATTASLAVPPGQQMLYSLASQGATLPTTISIIAHTSNGNVQVQLGYGGN